MSTPASHAFADGVDPEVASQTGTMPQPPAAITDDDEDGLVDE